MYWKNRDFEISVNCVVPENIHIPTTEGIGVRVGRYTFTVNFCCVCPTTKMASATVQPSTLYTVIKLMLIMSTVRLR